MLRFEHNARVHLFATIVVIALGFWLSISLFDWIALAIVIGLVFISELLNTALEELCNLVEPNHNPKIAIIKDFAAAAVLIASILAVIIGVLVFVPKLI